MTDIIIDVLRDSIRILPFLFGAYLLIELLETVSEEKTVALVHRAGKWGPVIGGALGVIPQCGFSAATANLYAGGIITRGTVPSFRRKSAFAWAIDSSTIASGARS